MKGTVLKAVATAALLLGLSVAGSSHAEAQQRIVGGSDVDISIFPSTVAVIINSRLFSDYPVYEAQSCGGTLISSTWVVTAAHCLVENGRIFSPSEISVLSGTTDLKEPVTSRISVSKIVMHPSYVQVVFGDDIALLQLSEPASSPAIEMNDTQLAANELTYIVGWGSSINIREDGTGSFPHILQSASIPTIQTSDCAALSGNYQFVNTDTQICAGYPQGGIDSCSGDSGGPLYNVAKDGNLRLAGITSWGDGCAIANQPGIYTNVAAYRNWIDQAMGTSAPTLTQEPTQPRDDVGIRASGGGGGGTILFVPLMLIYARFKSSRKSRK